MKNFKYPLAIEGSEEELKALIPKLEKLGYEFDTTFYVRWENNSRYLVTDFGNSYEIRFDYLTSDQTIVQASNPNLVLALAAMVNDDEFHKGEIVYSVHRKKCELADGVVGSKVSRYYRKATKEEIIAHFTPKTMQDKQEKVLLGYGIADEFNTVDKIGLIALVLGCSSHVFNDGTFLRFNDDNHIAKARDLKVLNLWFKPVYKEDKPKVKIITLSCEGGTFEVEVSKNGIFYRPDQIWLNIGSLRQVVDKVINYESYTHKVSGYDFKYTRPHVDSGCKKRVPVLDWKKAIDTFDDMQHI